MSIQQTPDSSTSARSEPDPAVRPAAPVTEANLAAHMARLDAMDRPATATTQADPRVHDRITLPRAVAAAAPTHDTMHLSPSVRAWLSSTDEPFVRWWRGGGHGNIVSRDRVHANREAQSGSNGEEGTKR